MTSTDRTPLRLVPPLLDADRPDLPAPRRADDGTRSPRAPGDAPPPVEPVGDGAAPGEAECLPCYVDRLVAREGCDGTLRWSRRWRDARAPRAAKLENRLADRGGFCDCEVLLNVYPWHVRVPDEVDGRVDATDDERPPCLGRPRGRATDPCRPPAKPWWA